MRMIRKLRTTAGLAAALAMAGLSGAASAQRLPEPRPECMQEVRAYCAAYWQVDVQFDFASEAECVQAYTEQCHYEWSYWVEAAPKAVATVRKA
ncbi:MAG TPA: hypothetical protein VEW26_12835 [Allosphingosinicella sp.]|nr:hypothetical protein [Allosphingosinicella sp.]